MKKLIYIFTILSIIFLILFYSNNTSISYESKNYSYLNNLNKIIIVGDSRFELINNKKDRLNIPNNYIFISKSGAGISWLKDTAIDKLKDQLNETDNNYNYSVIFNLGVNDLDDIDDNEIANRVGEYLKLYLPIIENHKNINFYFLSVNPIDENKINSHFTSNTRTNKKIELFNEIIENYIIESNINNFYYCDSYNSLEFNLPDGLHYDDDTDKKIIDYIGNVCIRKG